MAHVAVVVVSVLVSLTVSRRLLVVTLLVVIAHQVFHKPNSNPKNYIHAILELSLAEKLSLIKHFKIATKSQQAVTTSLMLRTNPTASNFIT
jgi:hypothetical protein